MIDPPRGRVTVNGGSISYASGSGPSSLNEASGFAYPVPKDANGVSYQRSSVRISSISHGTSNVFLIGEKWAPMVWVGDEGYNQPIVNGDCFDIRRFTHSIPRADRMPKGDPTIFGSSHAGGTVLSFCDGSTRVIEFSVHPSLFKQLFAIDDADSFR